MFAINGGKLSTDNPSPSSRIGVIALVAANLIAAASVLRHPWGYYQLLLIYWCDTILIALEGAASVVVTSLFGETARKSEAGAGLHRLFSAAALLLFFLTMFGGAALFLGIFAFLVPGFLAGPGNEGTDILHALKAVGPGLSAALTALLASHVIAFVANFLFRGQYRRASVALLLLWPYVRMALVLVVVAAGLLLARLVPAKGGSVAFGAAIVGVKIAVDLLGQFFDPTRVAGEPATASAR